MDEITEQSINQININQNSLMAGNYAIVVFVLLWLWNLVQFEGLIWVDPTTNLYVHFNKFATKSYRLVPIQISTDFIS